jgi:predicted dehydrogenase
MVVEAAEAGKHILCEKPIATTLEDAHAMIAACQNNKVKLQIAFPCRFHPAVTKVRQMLEQGAIGEVLAVNCTNRGRMPGGWFVDKKLAGGGAVMDHTVHVVDLLRWMLKTEVIRVYAEIDTRFHPLKVDDCGILSLTLQNGIFATLDASWSRPVKSFPTWGDVTMEFTGTQGILTLDTFAQNLTLHTEEQGKSQWINWGDNMDLGLIKDWVETIKTEKEPSVSGEDALKALEITLAAYQSASAKGVVQL